MSEVGKHADIHFLPAIDEPSREQLSYFLEKAALYDEIAERGGMTQEEARYERLLMLGRIGMGNVRQDKPRNIRLV